MANLANAAQHLITHGGDNLFNMDSHEKRLESIAQPTLPLSEEKEMLHQLSEFELGKFILNNKGLNGYWTAYLILHGPKQNDVSPLEHWLLHDAPGVKATRERFHIFKEQLQNRIQPEMILASIPCGLMDDLLSLDYASASGVHLVGIDLDQESLDLAEKNAQTTQCAHISFLKKSAWDLGVTHTFDLITSNGLNIYEPDDEKVIALYKEFYKALTLNGTLITSFLTTPPMLDTNSPWKILDPAALQKQKALFNDVIGVTFQCFRTEAQTRSQLKAAGFSAIDIIYDTQGMFPTVIAKQ
ncbi:MAG: class I SAM-dependent methyltransferase [Alphaproteobacteria bacterium]|nr:class I SAM-dependent methyltransferase [Alphaproteobacteria bacterium]